ncbi:MAG: hypothetical protein HKN41_11185 [Ilumatobacter sp.]|nr:hypothetical protein [Ilumatobacter sp.]
MGFRRAITVSTAIAALASCGGGDDDATSIFGADVADPGAAEDVLGSDGDQEGQGGEGDGGGFGLTADPVDVSGMAPPPDAESRTAVVEVADVRIEFYAPGTSGYVCTATPERIEMRMEGRNEAGLQGGLITLRADAVEGGWTGTGALEHPDREHTDLSPDRAELIVDGSMVTYRGPMVPRQRFGEDPNDHLGALTFDCGSEDLVATAMVDGTTTEVAVNGSQRFDCRYEDTAFDYEVEGGQFPDLVSLSVDGRIDGDWIGTAVVDLGDDRYTGVVRADTFEAGPDGVTWSGEATHTSESEPELEEQVPMSIEIPCG